MKRNTYWHNILIIKTIEEGQNLLYREDYQHHTSSYSYSIPASVVRTCLGSGAA